jgi:hypothetical protein
MSELQLWQDHQDLPPHAEAQRDRLYDLLSEQGKEHSQLLRDVGTKLDKLTDACSSMSGEISALKVTPSLIRLLVVALVLGVIGLGVVVGRSVAVDGFGLHAGTGETAGQPTVAPESETP